MAQPKKRSDTVIVHELLAFLQNQLNIVDEASLEQICSLHYTDEDISEAKNVLQRSAKTSVFLPTRKNKTKSLQDMFRVFKETDPDNLPTYVARDLHLLPSVAMDHDIISMLLKDILQLRTELKAAQSKRSGAEPNVDSQSEITSSSTESVGSVQSLVSSVPETSRSVSPNSRTTKEERNIASASRSVSTDSIVTSTNSYRSSMPSATSSVLKQRASNETTPETSRPESSLAEEYTASTSTSHPSARVVDEDGFTLVENRKHRSNSQSEKNPAQKGLDREQLIVQKEFQITGVLENTDENVMEITKLIFSSMRLLVNKRDIVDARRVGPLRMGKEADQRPRPIVVRVSRRALQQQVLSRARELGDNILGEWYYDLSWSTPIYIRERLTKANRELLHKARLLCKENDWKYAWSRDGMIFVKEVEGKPTFQVHNTNDLKTLF